MTPAVIAIVGATATGKSALALDLAEALGGEVVNADALQFYRGMDIGTAKLPVAQRRGIAHHQLDTLDVTEDANVAAYQRDARADIDDIHRRGRRAIVVGGSGLYLRALLDDFRFQPTDRAVRAELEDRADREGPGALHRELAAVDPAAAAKIEPGNSKRIVRALEVIRLTGEPYVSSLPEPKYAFPVHQIGLAIDYGVLDPRIEARVDAMFDAGLLDEVRALDERGLRDGVTARRAVGYAEVLDHFDGRLSVAEARDLIAQHTRRLARKQLKWFRPDERIRWVDAPVDEGDQARCTADTLALLATLEA